MQTFLPSTSLEQSAKWIDNLRLGKQRVECIQILKALTDPSYGWQAHPAVTMWRGHEAALGRYGLIICEEWIQRGYKDTCYQKMVDLFDGTIPYQETPPWLTEEFASNHRAILLGKVQEKYEETQADWMEAIYGNKPLDEQHKVTGRTIKAIQQLEWYQQFGWTEQPAKRNEDGRWPYLWPEVTR